MEDKPDVKPFKEYDELITLLLDRGMTIKNRERAKRKIAQVGYYRLSGYWYNSRIYKQVDYKTREFESNFRKGVTFDDIFSLYIFDKKLRLEITDAIERIEIFLRTIIAHEIGCISPIAYLDKKQFSRDAFKPESKIPKYDEWLEKHDSLIERSKEECIIHHKKTGKKLPLWVACEAWDFGTLSTFYSMLKGSNQDLICARIGIDNRSVLDNWLININGLRNRCAHHSRLFNKQNPRRLKTPRLGYFNTLNLGEEEKTKLYGLLSVIWFLLTRIATNSNWICRVADLVDSMPTVPGASIHSLGINTNKFPRHNIQALNQSNDIAVDVEGDNLFITTDNINDVLDKLSSFDFSKQDTELLSDLSEKLLEIAENVENNIS
ncbi:Abi family protein [Litorilituus sediminis]|uniref:Abi family protein n=1 Tax=Litorilituus sediminis TaxID=718192 RepID=A0A4P6P515_9GAMM|nr:Abi family protein [Litorilituus sediminis]QBG36563.1 Abi family protein [Litorilituus sediminis]